MSTYAWTIRKEFAFEAAHSLTHLPDGHKCKRPHGHSYRVEVALRAEKLDPRGFAVMDYAELDTLGNYIREKFDHRDLNVVMGSGENTTAEKLARHFFNRCEEWWPETVCVRLYETAKTCVEYGRA